MRQTITRVRNFILLNKDYCVGKLVDVGVLVKINHKTLSLYTHLILSQKLSDYTRAHFM